jgi:hypothetical protein
VFLTSYWVLAKSLILLLLCIKGMECTKRWRCVADDHDEPLITMDSPEEDKAAADYLDKISISTGS